MSAYRSWRDQAMLIHEGLYLTGVEYVVCWCISILNPVMGVACGAWCMVVRGLIADHGMFKAVLRTSSTVY